MQAEVVEDDLPTTESALGAEDFKSETVTFFDNAAGVSVEMPTSSNPVAKVDGTDDLSLGSFLARPTLIDTTSWGTADVVGVKTNIQPWYAFLNSTAIKKKIDNFAYIRGNLHVKVVLNGTPFQYGAIRTVYQPLLGWQTTKIRTNPSSTGPLLIPYSQLPGFFVHPQANAGGEMTLRFFLHKNWMNMTSATEVQNMGTLSHVIYAPLRLAVSGGTTIVTVRTYAWMTDVELMGSTNLLTLQGGDEYGDGPISLPASAIAAAAGALTKIPIISRFARATEIGAGAISKMASLFGYTNVPVIEDVQGAQLLTAPHLATAQIGAPYQKLSYDPKQELSIDPSFHGIGSHDELAMAYLRTKESYFGSLAWNTSDATDLTLFNMRINPQQGTYITLQNTVPANVGVRAYHVPLSYIGNLFRHWRGSLKVRIKVVCTKFHKGRLKISYDPRGDISTTNPPENTVYTQILDIGEKDDITFEIPYHQDIGWMETDDSFTSNWNLGTTLPPRAGIDNGLLSIRVLNSLTAPASSTVNILFFLSGGDDFEYANPKRMLQQNQLTPSFFPLQSEDVTDVTTETVVVGSKNPPSDDRYGLNYGECIASLRVVLHRMSRVNTAFAISSFTVSAASAYYSALGLLRMPFTPGYDPQASFQASNIVAATGVSQAVLNYMHPLPYITSMFLGYRGSVNYVVTPSASNLTSIDDFRVARAAQAGTSLTNRLGYSVRKDTLGSAASTTKLYSPWGGFVATDGIGGQALISTRTSNSLTFNFPDYNNYNFGFADPYNYVLGSSADGTATCGAYVTLSTTTSLSTDQNPTNSMLLHIDAGAGPDFTPIHFLCCPTLDFATVNIPVA